MAHSTRVTFPGPVQFAGKPAKPAEPAAWQAAVDENGRPLRTVRNTDEKGAFKSTTVTVPAGKRLTYETKPAPAVFGGSLRPTFVVTMADDAPAEPVHAELEHHPATELDPAHVTATSTKHMVDGEPLRAVGSTAADAVRFLAETVKLHVAKGAAADDDAKKKAEDAKTAADVAKELHNSRPPPAAKEDGETVTRHG